MVCWTFSWVVFVLLTKATVYGQGTVVDIRTAQEHRVKSFIIKSRAKTHAEIYLAGGNKYCEEMEWSYGDGPLGPANWAENIPIQCAGNFQSPIDINTLKTVHGPYLTKFMFTKPSPGSTFVVQNNGHTIQVDINGNFGLRGGGLKSVYNIEQFHFHWGDRSHYGSEHTVNGVAYPIEMHIVSWNTDYASMMDASNYPDGLAVLGVLFYVSKYDNPVLEPIIQAIPHVTDPDWMKRVEIRPTSIRNLLPRTANRFYRYHGSLTTPNCLESVIWTVFDEMLPISERQLNRFREALYPRRDPGNSVRERLVNNFRPVQPLNGRIVYRSFPFPPHK